MNQAIFSLVHSLAAISRSPSFSLLSSSMTTTNFPAAKAARADSMEEKGEADIRGGGGVRLLKIGGSDGWGRYCEELEWE
jgi:hypothetical protein